MEELKVLVSAIDRGISKGVYNLEETRNIITAIERIGSKLSKDKEPMPKIKKD